MREQYGEAGLRRSDLHPNPVAQFQDWLDAWAATRPYDANAMIVATTGSDGWPSARAVLLKGIDQRGFVFYTNRLSEKGRHLKANARAALCWLWHPIERQVRAVGPVEHLPDAESDAYFNSRPRGAQIAAVASPQSRVIADRDALRRLNATVEGQFGGPDASGTQVPRPPHWGGYLVRPASVEFWQGRRNRLHDRLRYRRPESQWHTDVSQSDWIVERIAP